MTQIEPAEADWMAEYEQATAEASQSIYVLRLFVTGITHRSSTAIANLKALCETHLVGRYELEVVDLYKTPHLASEEQIVAAPTLIKRLPPPLRRIVGDLSNQEQVLVGLDLKDPDHEPTRSSGGD